MRRISGIFLAGALLLLSGGTSVRAADEPSKEGIEFFEKNIRPTLAETCWKCHSVEAKANKKLKGRLYLDSWEGMTKGGESEKPAVVPGKPKESLLIFSISYTDKETADHDPLLMPPPKEGKSNKLPDDVIKNFEKWVEMGAPHPKEFDKPPAPKAEGPAGTPGAKTATAAAPADGKDHWSFLPVREPAVPAVKNAAWTKNGIDNFIAAKLEAKGLTPSPSADRRALIRRVTFDLTGLPPTPEEVDAFVNDKSANAYEKVIDRLLASPRYGERWGRHWLDVARYSDTKGYVFQEERRYPFAYTYRDWVIQSLNEDLPYDQFLIRQIAADQLDLGADKRPLAAMGFLTLGRRFLNQQPDIIDDRIDVLCRGTMALTVACARCHDHKFDPIPTKDYYSLYGVFASSIEPKDLPLIGDPSANATPASLAFEKELKARQAAAEEFVGKKSAEILTQLRSAKGITDCLMVTLSEGDAGSDSAAVDLGRFVVKRWKEYMGQRPASDPVFAAWRAYAAIPAKEFASKSAAVTEQITAKGKSGEIHPLVAEAFSGKPPKSMREVAERYGQLLSKADKAEPVSDASQEKLRLVLRGPDSPLTVTPADMPMLFRRDSREQYAALKRKVDEWNATNPSAPPRAMVMLDAPNPHDTPVLVRGNPGNPGPVVPRQFLGIISGSQRKPFSKGSGRLELARSIASKENPLTARVFVNRIWQWHFGQGIVRTASDFGTRADPPTHPELLDYLALRFVENGWSIKKLHKLILMSATYQQSSDDNAKARAADVENTLVWRFPRQRLDFEPTRDAMLFVSGRLDATIGGRAVDITSADSTRRTVYGFIDRQNLPGMFRSFDFASPDTHSPQRFTTTVPQQALFFMNSPFVRKQAQALIQRPDVSSVTEPPARVRKLYRLLYGREATEEEVLLGVEFVESESSQASGKMPAWEKYAQVLLESNEFVFVD